MPKDAEAPAPEDSCAAAARETAGKPATAIRMPPLRRKSRRIRSNAFIPSSSGRECHCTRGYDRPRVPVARTPDFASVLFILRDELLFVPIQFLRSSSTRNQQHAIAESNCLIFFHCVFQGGLLRVEDTAPQ